MATGLVGGLLEHSGFHGIAAERDDRVAGNNFLDDLVASGFPIPESLLALAIDGCLPENLDPAVFWDVTTHFTVAHLRVAFGIDAAPVGLGDGVASAFPGVTMTYHHEP